MAIHPIILSGGSGTRLWPLSRKSYPKQFSKLVGDEALFQSCVRRLSDAGFAAPVILTNSDFRFIVAEQLADIGVTPDAIVIEPEGRDTAPAILAAALRLNAQDPEGLMLVAPSDHVLPDTAAFGAAVQAATAAAQEGQLITFGIQPDRPETGYGYLELSEGLAEDLTGPVPLRRFIEKPDADTARDMVATGTFLWNAGLFLFKVSTILEAFRAHAPDLVEPATRAVAEAQTDLGFLRLAPEPWQELRAISIDYAVMEKAGNLSVMPYRGAWSDLGSWEAVMRESARDDTGVHSSGPVTAIDCADSLLRSESEKLELVGIGLRDIVVVAMPDAVLVSDASRTQEVKAAVSALKARQVPQATQLPVDYRPWGFFESLAIGPRFQVKRIVVHPGASLSLQSHHHRSEHWIVVQGTARVTVDETVKLVSENESIYIPLGATHRMENPGKVDMILIEVQTGSYLGEDDMIRYEDVYARS